MTDTQQAIIWKILIAETIVKQNEMMAPLVEEFFEGETLMVFKTIKSVLASHQLATYHKIIKEGHPTDQLLIYASKTTGASDEYQSLLLELKEEYGKIAMGKLNKADFSKLEQGISKIKMNMARLNPESSQDIGDALIQSVNDQLGESAIDLDHIANTGVKNIDTNYQGFIPGDMVVIGGFSGVGKSTLLFSIIMTLASQGQSLFYSGEMTKQSIVARFLSAKADIPYELALQNGLPHIEHKIKALNRIDQRNKAMNEIAELQLDLIDKTMSFEQLLIEAEKLVKDKSLKYLFIDYIQLLYLNNSTGNQTQDMSYISRELKLFAQRNRVIVFGLAQINKAGMNAEVPGVEHIADSSRIAANSDTVFILYTKKVNDERITYLSVAKSRMFNSGGIFQLDYNHKTKSYA